MDRNFECIFRGRSVTCGTSSKWTSLLSSALSRPPSSFSKSLPWRHSHFAQGDISRIKDNKTVQFHKRLALEAIKRLKRLSDLSKTCFGAMAFWIRCCFEVPRIWFASWLLSILWSCLERGRWLVIASWIGRSTRLEQFMETSAKLNPSGGLYGKTSLGLNW